MSSPRFCTVCEDYVVLNDSAELVDMIHRNDRSQLWIDEGVCHILLSQKLSDRRRMKTWVFAKSTKESREQQN